MLLRGEETSPRSASGLWRERERGTERERAGRDRGREVPSGVSRESGARERERERGVERDLGRLGVEGGGGCSWYVDL